jgi:hypothetical protein
MDDRQSRLLVQALVLMCLILAAIAAALWLRPVGVESAAQARIVSTAGMPGVPDAGRQRQDMVDELKALNERMASIESGLKAGRFVVQVEQAESEDEEGKR